MQIKKGGLDDPRVLALLADHIAAARSHTACDSAHVLDVLGLTSPDVQFWTAWDGDLVLGMGALTRISHHPSATTAKLRVPSGRAPSAVLSGLKARLRASPVRASRIHRHFGALAAKAGEKSGLKLLDGCHGEIKSMHTHRDHRRRGVAAAILNQIILAAQDMGLSRISLETGSWPYFDAARACYRRHGFVECPPFGSYVADPNSVFMTLVLAPASLS